MVIVISTAQAAESTLVALPGFQGGVPAQYGACDPGSKAPEPWHFGGACSGARGLGAGSSGAGGSTPIIVD